MKFWRSILRDLGWLTQLGLSLIMPMLLCVGGCWWLQQRFSLGGWILAVGFFLGLGSSAATAAGFSRHVRRRAEKEKRQPPDAFNSHR